MTSLSTRFFGQPSDRRYRDLPVSMRGAAYNSGRSLIQPVEKRMRRFLLLTLVLACGGTSVEWAGKWKQPTGIPPGSYLEMTLGGSGNSISGTGVSHREAGADVSFTVSGSPAAGVTLAYDGGTTESFTFAQPDSNHLTLTNSNRAVELVRQ